jgi:hypothetical protein
MSRKSSRNPSALIREGKLRTATFDICLDPDLIEEYRQLDAKRSMRLAETQDSLAGSKAPEFDEPLGQLREAIEEATLTLTLRALPRPKFRELCDKFPPRRNEEGTIEIAEDMIGVNFNEFFPAILPLSIVEPELTDDDLRVLVDERLDDRQWGDLTDVIWDLNRARVNIPFSSTA